MADGRQCRVLHINMDERKLSIIVHSLFSSWMLAFIFEGQILYALVNPYNVTLDIMVFGGIAAHFLGLFLCGFFIKTKKGAKRLFLCSYPFFIASSAVFFLPPSVLWALGFITSSLLSGGCVAAWGFYFKSGTPKNKRIKTAADVLICSNVLMIFLNMVAIHLSPHVGLALSMLMLLGAFLLALLLTDKDVPPSFPNEKRSSTSIAGPFVFLFFFIVIITINSGLMYQVINPAFAHLDWFTSLYWAIPYIVALFIMRDLPRKTNRAYALYVAIAMIGFSFIAFVIFDISVASYFVVNTLMLGACGICDLFWWSILGEMLDFYKNPAKLFGIGLSANVLGVGIGGLIGSAIYSEEMQIFNSTLLALAVVCVTLVILPPLHKYLSSSLKDNAYLVMFSKMLPDEQNKTTDQFQNLSKRESQVAELLLLGKTYRIIASELYISENTVKYHIKNIYSKYGIKSRTELINMFMKKEKVSQ